MPDHIASNAASRDRIRALAANAPAANAPAANAPASAPGLDAAPRPDGDGAWGPTVVLAHVAFWDRMGLARWQRADSLGQPFPPPVPDGISDLVNDASVDQWGSLSTAEAAVLALRAAEALDAFIERLPEDRVEAALAAGFTRLVDRSLHRNEHLDDLDRPRA